MNREERFKKLLESYLLLINEVIENGSDQILNLELLVNSLADDLSEFREVN